MLVTEHVVQSLAMIAWTACQPTSAPAIVNVKSEAV